MTAACAALAVGACTMWGAFAGTIPATGSYDPGRETEETETETEGADLSGTEAAGLPEVEERFSWLDAFVSSKNAADVCEEDGMVMAASTADAGWAEWPAPAWNTEEYATVGETGFRTAAQYPFSTFGMDVDTASYALLRRNLLDGTMEWMPEDAVRIEEMINYFNYEYAQPEDGDTFSITCEIAPCPWNPDTKLMLVGLQARDIPKEEIPEQNLVLLVDTSGSMYDENKLPLAVDTMKLLLEEMDGKDTISLVTYAGSSEVLLSGVHCTPEGKEEILEALDGLTAEGGTWGETGLRTAYALAQDSFTEGANNRVLLLTDGDFNLGQTDDSELVKMVQEQAKGQIFLSILGFGAGNYNDALAEELADKGNGNYSYIDSAMEARRVMGGALKGTLNTVAKDAKIQIDFNPAMVKGYRQIGYENRQMDAEDFEDDTKDGGEVGAGQQVSALYELVMADSAYEIQSARSRYAQSEAAEEKAQSRDGQTEAAAENEEYLTISVRYKEPDGEKSSLQEAAVDASAEMKEMSENMSWAGGVAQAGMLLRGSEHAGNSDFETVRERLRKLTGGDEFREEFIYLLTRMAA